MEDLEIVRKRRKGIRARCTAICNEVKDECKKAKVTDAEWKAIVAKLDCLCVRENDLNALNEKVVQLEDTEFFDGDLYEQELDTVDRYRCMIKETKLIVEGKGPVGSKVSGKAAQVAVRLPVLELPSFNGDITQYKSFIQAFEATIDENGQLSELDKFNYLKSLVKGEASRVIQPLPVTKENYKIAKDVLEDHFGQTESIVQAHLKALASVKPVRDVRDVAGLKELVNVVEFHTMAIQNLGVEPTEYNFLLFNSVSALLPEEVVLNYCRKKGPAEVDELLRWLKEEIANLWRCKLLLQREELKDGVKISKVLRPRSAAVLHVGEEEEEMGAMVAGVAERTNRVVNRRGNVNPFCVLCFDFGHWTDRCQVKRSWEEVVGILKRKGRCFRCASRDHMARDCRNPRAVCERCQGQHFTVLCPDRREEKEEDQGEVASMSVQAEEKGWGLKNPLLQTAHALVKSTKTKQMKDIRLLLDGGSQCSFVRKKVAEELGLHVVEVVKVNLNTFGGGTEKMRCNVVIVPLFNRDCVLISGVRALVIPKLSVQEMPYVSGEVEKELGKRGMRLADVPIWPGAKESGEIDLLIGVDAYWDIVEGERVRMGGCLVAVSSKLGWVLQGSQPTIVNEPRTDEVQVNFISVGESRCEDGDWIWDQVKRGKKEGRNEEVEEVVVERVGEKYQVNLPWIVDRKHRLSNNVQVAQQRLNQLINRLRRQPELLIKYHEAMRQYVVDGHAVKAVPSLESDPGYFLPHQVVVRQGTTTDIRVVFDASAKAYRELSLNECISAGEDRHLDVVGILLRFRQNRYAVVADVKKAFLQVKMRPDDQLYLKYLWLNVERDIIEPVEVVEYQMTRVTFGVSASPYLLKKVLTKHLQRYDECAELVQICIKNLYVDDVGASYEEEEQVEFSQKKWEKWFKDGGFELRKWATNSKRVREQWQREGVEQVKGDITSVLGLEWNVVEDQLRVKIPVELIKTETVWTKREVLSVVASVFDPLGIMSVLTIKAKLFVQKLWKLSRNWDEVIREQEIEEWKSWRKEALNCGDVLIPRWSGLQRDRILELHAFSDASLQAYGAVLYLRVVDPMGGDEVHFQRAKYKVAPMKEESVPRLELRGAMVALKLVNDWIEEVEFEQVKVWFWSDSEVVIAWVKNKEKPREVVVQRKLEKIWQESHTEDWHHCPGVKNPADKGTRNDKEVNSQIINKWLKGPGWLVNEQMWPNKVERDTDESNVQQNVCQAVVQVEECVIKVKRMSTWRKLLKVTAWCMRFIRNCRVQKDRTQGGLESEELREAEVWWVKRVQRDTYAREIKELQEEGKVHRASTLSRFHLYLDKRGLLRMNSRLQAGHMRYDIVYPWIVPGDHEAVRLFIKHRHEVLLHAGVTTLLTDLRQNCWVMRARRECKRVVNKCSVCCRVQSQNFKPRTGQLPIERLQTGVAFETIGLDFAGPIYMKGEANEKAYILLITCFYSRGVHLELVSSMKTEQFVLAFQRFIARRGQPKTIFSDNALTFKKASRVIKQALTYTTSMPKLSYFKLDYIHWKFIPERAPWMGGLWERMVRSVKMVLKRVMGNARLSFEELSTVLVSVEGVINSRPLCPAAADDIERVPLTPSHLMLGRSLTSLPLYELPSRIPEVCYMTRYLYLQTALQHFNRRWINEYLLQLANHHWSSSGTPYQPKEGEVVLLKEDNVKRQLYSLAKVNQLVIGRDGVARSAKLQLPDQKQVTRPVRLLFPLEIQVDDRGG